MAIPEELKNLLQVGDLTMIKELYDERHRQGDEPDHKTVSVEYVRLVIGGKRVTKRKGTAADEIVRITNKYLEHKRKFRDSILL